MSLARSYYHLIVVLVDITKRMKRNKITQCVIYHQKNCTIYFILVSINQKAILSKFSILQIHTAKYTNTVAVQR